MKEYIYDFLLMVQFLTRLPVKRSLPCEAKNFRDGAAMLPLVGLLVGGIQWIVYYGCMRLFPVEVTTVLTLAVGVLIMGCLHQDGFGDIFDGFFSFKGDKDKIIEIMKDSRIGTFASVALMFDILARYAAINFIILKGWHFVIIIAPVISRCTLVFLFLIGKNAKKNGTGNLFIGNVSIWHFIISFIVTIALSIVFIGVESTIIVIPVAFIVTLLFLKLCNSKIGGITGDCLGANNEFVELAILIAFTAILRV